MTLPSAHEPEAARLEANWRAIAAELDAPRASWPERALRRLGVPSSTARVALATPALRRAWFLAIAVVVVIGLGASNPDDPRQSTFTLLFLAPLAPVLGVALAYGPGADPAYEAHLATPMRGLRLLLLRCVTVFVVAVVTIGGGALLVDETRAVAAAWILPALAATALALSLCTFVAPRRAATVAAVAWVGAALAGRTFAEDGLGAFAPAAQVVAVGVAVASLVVAVRRHDHLDRLVPS